MPEFGCRILGQVRASLRDPGDPVRIELVDDTAFGNGLNGGFHRLQVSWTKTAANGRTVKISFCSDCGVRLFHEPARNPKIVNVKPGALDDTAWVRPMGHLWLDSAQPWFMPPSDALHYAGQPDSFDDLFARFDAYLADITDQR